MKKRMIQSQAFRDYVRSLFQHTGWRYYDVTLDSGLSNNSISALKQGRLNEVPTLLALLGCQRAYMDASATPGPGTCSAFDRSVLALIHALLDENEAYMRDECK